MRKGAAIASPPGWSPGCPSAWHSREAASFLERALAVLARRRDGAGARAPPASARVPRDDRLTIDIPTSIVRNVLYHSAIRRGSGSTSAKAQVLARTLGAPTPARARLPLHR